MMSMRQEIQSYFEKLYKRLKKEGKQNPIVSNLKGNKNNLLISDPDDSGWCQWRPVEKDEITQFDFLENKYDIKLHADIKDYYSQSWFYEIYGKIYINEYQKHEIVELDRVLPNQELKDLEAHIGQYYWGRDLKNFLMIPMGMVQNSFVVVDNNTGEVFLDDNSETGAFIKIAANLPELIGKLEP